MKWLIFFLVLPFSSVSQTIHFDDEKIIYEGTAKVSGQSVNQIYSQFEPALDLSIGKKNRQVEAVPGQNKIVTTGTFKLNSPFHIIRKVHFVLQLTAKDGGYTYQIDSVSLSEKRRGGKTETKDSEELLEGIEETGAAASSAEKLLNEIDMRFQKLLAVLNKQMAGK